MLEWELVTPSGTTPRLAAEPPSQRTAPSRRRRRRSRWWLGLLGLGLVGVVAAAVAAPLVGAYVVEHMVVPRLSTRYGVDVLVAETKVRPTRVILRGLTVRVPGKVDPVVAPRAEVHFAFWPLLRGQVELTEVHLERPVVQIVRGGDEDNISALLQRLRTPSEAPAEPSRRRWLTGPLTITTQGAEVDVRDDAGVFHVSGVDGEVHRRGASQLTLLDSVAEIAGGASARADRVVVRWQSNERFLPAGLPEIEVAGGSVVPWRRLAMTGISGTIKPDPAAPARAVIALAGGYGGVERQLWQAKGWVLPDGSGGLLSQRSAEAELSVFAQRFRLSSLEPILKDTPIIDADQTEVDASLELRFAQRVLDFAGKFHMAGLTVFSPRLVAEPVRDIGLDLSARGRVDLKTRRFRLDKAAVRWNGATAELEAEAEAQPASALRRQPPVAVPAPAPGQLPPPAGASWRERWRTVSLHLTVPPVDCQALLDSMPEAIVPRIRDFKLAGSFSTDVRVFVDFAKLLKMPPLKDPNSPEEEEGNELAAASPHPPAPPVQIAPPPKGKPQRPSANGAQVALVKDPKDDPVQLSGKVGIDGCKVLEAPKDMTAARFLDSFEHTVLVEGDRELRFVIGPENPDFVPYEDISPYLINSIMTTEDNGFLRHRGFIVPEFRSALQANLERGYFRLGASSITMQMVKNVLLSREKTLSRKMQELFLTWYLENNLTSDPELLKAISKGTSPNQFWLNKLQKGAAARIQAEGGPGPGAPSMGGSLKVAVGTQPSLPVSPTTTLTQSLTAPLTLAPGHGPAPVAGAGPGVAPVGAPGAAPPIDPMTGVTAAQAYSPLRDINPIKRRLLEIYFNAIEFGPYLYGIGKATRHYFGKSPKDLTPREAVWFSSILPNPKRRYIFFCKGAPDEKWDKYLDRILRRVHERGRLTDAEYVAALQERLLFDRTEALPEKDCIALIQRMTELPPAPPPAGPGTTPAGAAGTAGLPLTPPVKLPPPPPWAEADVRPPPRHH